MALLVSTRQGLFTLEETGEETHFGTDWDFLALARAPSSPGLAYAATVDGRVFRTVDCGCTWEARGVIGEYAELSSLAVDPRDPERLLAGMEPAALFLSGDGGASWTEDSVIRGMAGANGWSVPWGDAPGHVRCIAIDPADPGRVYLAIEVGGIVLTHDGGATWENVRGDLHDDVHSVAVHSRNGAILYAATRHGFGRSDDGGRTWRRGGAFEGQGYSRPLAVDPADPERIFTAAAPVGPGGFRRPEGSECAIYRSLDGGLTWHRLGGGLPERFGPYVDALDVHPEVPERVALADSEGHLYESVDGGDTWRQAARLPPVRRLIYLP